VSQLRLVWRAPKTRTPPVRPTKAPLLAGCGADGRAVESGRNPSNSICQKQEYPELVMQERRRFDASDLSLGCSCYLLMSTFTRPRDNGTRNIARRVVVLLANPSRTETVSQHFSSGINACWKHRLCPRVLLGSRMQVVQGRGAVEPAVGDGIRKVASCTEQSATESIFELRFLTRKGNGPFQTL
jgi:hypothetical protein